MPESPSPAATPDNGVGAFVWNELNTFDRASAAHFYRALFGWGLDHYSAGPGLESGMFKAGDRHVGGLVDNPDPKGPPFWLSYVKVAKLEDACARVAELGGAIVLPITAVPNVGRIAVLRDPQGAYLGLFDN